MMQRSADQGLIPASHLGELKAVRKVGGSLKQAVVVIHGMGEQIPMQTIMGFTEAVWTTDADLIDPMRPDSTTGGKRERNAIWFKPDARNRSYELRRLTTESVAARGSTDFYEFYWAHLMHGTAWEHFRRGFSTSSGGLRGAFRVALARHGGFCGSSRSPLPLPLLSP